MTQTNSGFTQIYMRGVGNAIYLGADPSVATFVDDVPRIYGSMTDSLVDLERIEVLKGAQGGLYGRNATGGVVNMITKTPTTDAFQGNATISYGEKNTFRASAYVNIPLSDKVAFSIGGNRQRHDGYIKNYATGNPFTAANFPTGSFLGTPEQTAAFFNSGTAHPPMETQDFWSIRGKLLFKPNDNLKIILAGDYYDKDDTGGGGQYNTTPALTQAALGGYFSALGINATFPAGFVSSGNGSKFTSSAGWPLTYPVKEYGASATITWNGPGFDLTSISAYRHQRTFLLSDVNSTNVPTALLQVRFHKFFVYQELRAISTYEGPLQVLGGVTYLDNTQSGGQRVALLNLAFNVGDGYVKDNVRNWSVYLQGTYNFTDALSLAVSGRYMRENNDALFTQPIVSPAHTVESKFIPAATLTYKLDQGSAYARWARGFKTGGINLATAAAYYPRPQDGSVFAPEVVDTYEIGYKQALFDRNVQVTGAVFYNDYKNLQVDGRARPAYPQLTTAVINAKSARTYGVEGSLQWRVSDPLTLGVTAGYLNARYKDFKLIGSIALEDFNRDGEQMQKAPKFQISFTGDIDQPINDAYRLIGSVLVSHTSQVIFQASPAIGVIPDAIGPGYWMTNARIGLRTTDDKYGLFVVADNLFNAKYTTFGQSGFTGVTLGWGNPRIIRGELQVKF
jgi:iron complex outermembrane receptor protein